MALNEDWFTEIEARAGSAYSLKINKKLHEEQTPYQKIEIFETMAYGNLMVIDGFVMLSGRDNFLYHEMMSHPVLYTHPDPQRVLIIGGGDCGTLREVLRHSSVKKVWQVEIDERVTRLAEQHFPELCESNNDERAELLFTDGIEWVRRCADNSLDIIIVDSTDPIGPAEGLFSAPFFQQCARILKPDGILVQQSESPLLHLHILKAMYEQMAQGGLHSMTTLNYPQSVYPSGWWSATMAWKTPRTTGQTGQDVPRFREADAAAKSFETEYYNTAIHKAAFALPEFVRRALAGIAAE
ncbi:MAG: polyamine aminopropyltransferase [Gammaproteobacteria bacterium]|nr:polyamine aminopropyltransferase [Gammaproteobacteria bacterium]MDH5799803.1 polyamine aminopropyltransferase [Gammaproteobacteria bacterium]